jgi:hypothetical protein
MRRREVKKKEDVLVVEEQEAAQEEEGRELGIWLQVYHLLVKTSKEIKEHSRSKRESDGSPVGAG